MAAVSLEPGFADARMASTSRRTERTSRLPLQAGDGREWKDAPPGLVKTRWRGYSGPRARIDWNGCGALSPGGADRVAAERLLSPCGTSRPEISNQHAPLRINGMQSISISFINPFFCRHFPPDGKQMRFTSAGVARGRLHNRPRANVTVRFTGGVIQRRHLEPHCVSIGDLYCAQ